MTDFMLFHEGDRVHAAPKGRVGELGTIQGFERGSDAREPVRWRVALDHGGTWLFLTEELEHAEQE